MKSIEVCLSPELMHLYDVSDKAVVVIDILRATSCMTTAFAHGAKSIVPFADVEECKRMKQSGFITSGERNGEKVEGFDKGNSPFEYMTDDIRNKRIAFTTTNGTQAIEKSKGAEELLIGSFLNLGAVVNFLKGNSEKAILLCAGWKGRVNLEDTLFAGAILEFFQDDFTVDDDAAIGALNLYQQAKSDLIGFLQQSSHVKRLNRLNIYKDIAFCLTIDKYNVLPRLQTGELVI